MKFLLLTLMIRAALVLIVFMPGCTAQQVSDEVVAAQVALAPFKAQIATLPNGPEKTRMQKTLNRLEKGAADAAGWAAAVAELESYFHDLIERLKTARNAPAVGANMAPTQPLGSVSGPPPN